ncbi:assimilatory nitrate reductase (NADH) alpha subunit apoprotein [Rhodobacter aestuarii]|uniref:Assimilatory nitrate reductase (NADH) alpha subunit apoprotein n=1 Tax=Rhodobacter aestuarii TaxID=453582 RepID=A0A1N7PWH5_9RHOB|nr:nitrate reductase [Rhodobacter aestuarii]PTV94121.1 assimilatory nitrate reductase (NADH) alpha subunit apoprotein [Rhodobacter aestuarii]SIT14787.1 assimilatory nitrate reductase (NADH) alpha subunit apoprotein [Rhodobacter aestuarii]
MTAITESAICTTCPYCGVGCGVTARPDGAGGLEIRGDKAHPANEGRLCSKGSALGETVGLEDRLLAPQIGGQEASWDTALDLVASKFRAAIAEHGPDAVAFYVSGQLLTEDYYVANKLMKGFIGSGNIDTNSRLCMASSVAGHRRAFGTDTVPGLYEDFDQAEVIVLVGSNLAWCHPVLYQRIAAAKSARPDLRVVVVDPRRTATCDLADLHLAIAPGGDAALFNGLLAQIAATGAVNAAYVAAHVTGFPEALAAAQASDPALTGLSDADLAAFYRLWIGSEKVVTVYSQGINQSSSGTDKVNAILNCHLATGRIGRPGMGPFSVTGQPNAMGGREVGGLANMLACHLDIENADHRGAVQGFWQSPAMAPGPGLKAVDMFRAVEAGQIKALWVICTNPAVSMPEADRVRAAIAGCDFVVVSDLTAQTDTAQLADVVLPATGWGEKDGTVTNSERRISRQRAVLPPPGQARHDWQILCDFAARMGWGAWFDYANPAAIFREYAALSGVAGALGRDFDISDLATLSDADYAALAPFTWPQSARKRGGRFFAEGQFYTPDARARMLPIVPRLPQSALSPDTPFRLNTGRVRDHWHTMTRTVKSARLSQHMGEPYLEIHPRDAARLGLGPAVLAEVSNTHGTALLRVLESARVPQGSVFAPMHWTAQTASAGRVDALVPATVDPVSGQPESKAATVRIAPFKAAWYGFAVSVQDVTPRCDYWAKARSKAGWRIELAGRDRPEDWEAFALDLFGRAEAQAITMIDQARGLARVALLQEGRVVAALFVAPEPVAVSRGHVAALLGAPDQPALLAGRAGADRPDPGATICACFDVGVNTVLAAIANQGLASVEAIGVALRAGTNCGSCRPELAALLAQARSAEAAA